MKLSLVLPGAIALMLSIAPMVSVMVEPAAAAPVRVAQRGENGLQKLNLTEEQKARLKQIRENNRSRMNAILTAEQKAELQRARQEQRKPNLNLTEEQKTQMKAIRQETKAQMDAVLTAEQRQQLEQMRQQRAQQRGQRQSPTTNQ